MKKTHDALRSICTDYEESINASQQEASTIPITTVKSSEMLSSAVSPQSVIVSPTEAMSVTVALQWAADNNHPKFEYLHHLARALLSAKTELSDLDKVGQVSSTFIKLDEITSTSVAILNAYKETLPIEPVGRLHLERLEMTPVGIERGELVYSVPLTPKETVNISHREWSEKTEGFENIVQDEFEGFSEKGVAEKVDVSQAAESQSRHATALNTSQSLSSTNQFTTLSSSFGYSATSDSEQSRKDSFNHSSLITSKAATRTHKDHKFSFKVSSVAGAEDLSVRVIQNQSDNPVRVDYYQMMRKWKIKLIRYGLRMTYDIVIPGPGSDLIQKIMQLDALNAEINTPYEFTLPISAVTRNTYKDLAAKYGAEVDRPPDDPSPILRHKEFKISKDDADGWIPDAFDFEVDADNQVVSATFSANIPSIHTHAQYHQLTLSGVGDIMILDGNGNVITDLTPAAIPELVGKNGKLAVQYMYIGLDVFTTKLIVELKLKDSALQAWQLKAWNQIQQADFEAFTRNIKFLESQRDALNAEIGAFDSLTLRQMEREAIMKGVLRWLFGPTFELVPSDIQSLFSPANPDSPTAVSLNPNAPQFQYDDNWLKVLEFGEFIKYIHNAIEWENVLYFMYPYFWDSPKNWKYKLFLNHPDPLHRMFLRAGAARVVLTIRPGFEEGFSQLMDTGAFQTTPKHPYVTIAQEIQNFAKTNYPGIPPANPDTSARPQLFWEQRMAWRDMQYLVQLLLAYHDDHGAYPSTDQGPGALQPYIDAVNTENSKLGNPTYQNLPLTDPWKHPYSYKCPGNTGDYDLVSYGADGKPDTKPGGTDINADIWANVDGSVIATWFEYTPTSALDLSVTPNLPVTSLIDMA